jgi:magnesium-transporting ATPase (P-type)
MAPGRFSFASDERRGSSQDEEYYDSMVDEAVVLDDTAVFERCFQHIDDFATEGLRTLLFGYKFLDEEEYSGMSFSITTMFISTCKLPWFQFPQRPTSALQDSPSFRTSTVLEGLQATISLFVLALNIEC